MAANKLPPFLQTAFDHAFKKRAVQNRQFLYKRWENFINKACYEIPTLSYNKKTELLSLGNISPGCELCRTGKWDCFFVSSKCNLSCNFCLSPKHLSESFIGSNWGCDLRNNLDIYQAFGIQGISFSGGEPLLNLDYLLNWIDLCHNDQNIKHIWLYTNGLLLSHEILGTLAEIGLDEIRVNAAATGYQHPHVMEMLRIASQNINWVTIEIPLLPTHTDKLLSAINNWFSAGVRVLNLHELLFEPDSNGENLEGERIEVQLLDGHHTAISPESDQIALSVFKHVSQQNLPMNVNYCSTVGKWQQLTARRELCLSEFMEPYETYLGNGILESYFITEDNQAKPIPSHAIKEIQRSRNGKPIYHLQRIAPLSFKDNRKNWILFEVIS